MGAGTPQQRRRPCLVLIGVQLNGKGLSGMSCFERESFGSVRQEMRAVAQSEGARAGAVE